jgi:hypothetical protein
MSDLGMELGVQLRDLIPRARDRLQGIGRGRKMVIGGLLAAVMLLTLAECAFDLSTKVDRIGSDKVWVACEFQSGKNPPFVRGQKIWIEEYPTSFGPAGLVYTIVGVDDGRVSENHFVKWNPDANFKVLEEHCTEKKFELAKYDLTGACAGRFPKEGGQATFFVLAEGTKHSSQKSRFQVRCSDGGFADFENQEATNPAVTKPSAPAANPKVNRSTRKSGRNPPKRVREPRRACTGPGRCGQPPASPPTPPQQTGRGLIGPR